MEPEKQTPVGEVKVKDETKEKAPVASSAATENTEPTPQEHMIPKSRFDEVNDKLKALEEVAAKSAKEKQAAEETSLAEQKRWQELAEKRRGERDELKPKADLADKLSEMVAAQYQTEIAAWPEQVRNMAPAADASILAKLEWANKARALAHELMEDKTPAGGNGRRPPPVSSANSAKAAEAAVVDWRKKAARRYR